MSKESYYLKLYPVNYYLSEIEARKPAQKLAK